MCDGTVLETKRSIKIRKRRVCFGCEKLFPIGSLMDHVTSIDAGTFYHTYWCMFCTEWFDQHYAECVGPGEIEENNWYPEFPSIQEGIANPWPMTK